MRFWSQLGFLIAFIGVGLVLTAVIGGAFVFVFAFLGKIDMGLHVTMWAQNLLLMISAPLLWTRFSYLRNASPESRTWRASFESLNMTRANWKFMFLTLCLMIISLPASDAVEVMSLHFPWPESIQQYCKDSFLQNQQVLMQLLQPTGVLGYIELILLMCVSAAIGEEMLFRGALLNCFVKCGRVNLHVAAWTIGLIFALIHFEMMGLLSRWLLGALFVYLVFWSRSLWPAIFAHFINNLVALISYKMSTPEELMTLDRDFSFSPYLTVCSFVVTSLLIWVMWRMRASKEE